MSENTSRKRQILKDTVDLLASHRQIVYGLCAAMQAEEANIEMFMSHTTECDMSPDNFDPGAHKTCVDDEASKNCVYPEARKTCIHFLSQSYQCLQYSIFRQSKTLKTSFDTLNKYILHHVLDTIRGTEESTFHFSQKSERSTQTVLSCKAIEKENTLDTSEIKQEKIEEVVIIRNQLWEKFLKYKEQFKEEKKRSATYQTEVNRLQEQLKELQNKHETDLQETVCHHISEVNKLNAVIKELQDKLQQHKKSENDLRESIINYKSEATKMNQLTSENHQLKDQLQKNREDSEKTLQETNRGHERKVRQLNASIQQQQEELQIQKDKNENLVQQVNELGGKITELKNLSQEKGEKNEKAMQESARKHGQLNEKVAELEERLKLEEKERKQEHENEIEAMKQSIEEERRNLEEQLDCFHRQARKRPIQLSYLGKGDLMPKVLEELKMALVDKLGIKRHELQFVTCLKESDVDTDIPLLALCINVSRLGTDATATMQNIQASKNVLLVILHHKDVHALPSQTSDRVLTGPEFHDLAGVYDIGFLADKGIYACNMNNAAIDGIVEFITKKKATMNTKPDK